MICVLSANFLSAPIQPIIPSSQVIPSGWSKATASGLGSLNESTRTVTSKNQGGHQGFSPFFLWHFYGDTNIPTIPIFYGCCKEAG